MVSAILSEEPRVAQQDFYFLRRPADWQSDRHVGVLIPCAREFIQPELLKTAIRGEEIPKLMFYPSETVSFLILRDEDRYHWGYSPSLIVDSDYKPVLVRLLRKALTVIDGRDESKDAWQWIGIINEVYWRDVRQTIQEWLDSNAK